jgi:hypothetical protein
MSGNAIPRGARWAPVSVSANIDTAYRQLWNEPPDKAYAYICWCEPPFEEESDADQDDEDDDEGKNACDGGNTCVCGKPAEEFPGHKWITMYACRRKFLC